VVICLERGPNCLHMVQLMPLHSQTRSSLSTFKSRQVLPFWYCVTQVILEKMPLNGCSSSFSCCCEYVKNQTVKWEKTELNSNSASTLQRQHAKCDEQCHNTHLTFHHFCPRLIFSFSSFSKQMSWHTIHTMEKAREFSAHGCHLHCLHAISITSRYCNKKTNSTTWCLETDILHLYS